MNANLSNFTKTVRLNSYKSCKSSKQITSIINYLPILLSRYPNGLTCNEISEITKIKVQSLTNPLNTLRLNGVLVANRHRYSLKTKRVNVVYELPELKKLELTLFPNVETSKNG